VRYDADPSLGKNDGLVGQVVGVEGSLPEVYQEVEVKYRLFRRLIGTVEGEQVEEMRSKENVLLHVGGNSAVGAVTFVKPKARRLVIKLTQMPICARYAPFSNPLPPQMLCY
jgi:translation initiation factor 2 subunit 3